MVNVDRAMEGLGRLAKVEDKDDLDPELEELPELQEAHDSRRSTTIRGKEDARSTSPPLTPSKTQEQATTEDNKAGKPRLVGHLCKEPTEESKQAPAMNPPMAIASPPHMLRNSGGRKRPNWRKSIKRKTRMRGRPRSAGQGWTRNAPR